MKEAVHGRSRWSGEAKAWLVYWLVLAVATPCLLYFLPEWFTLESRRDRSGRSLPTTKNLPSMFLFGFWFVGLCGWVMWFRNTRRSNALAIVATNLQLELKPTPTDEDWSCFHLFKFFQIGFQHAARNKLDGKFGSYDVTLLDYFFRRSGLPRDVEIETSSRKYHQTVVALWGVSQRLPDFQLVTRETGWFKPGQNRSPKASIEDLHIGKDGNADFHRHYLVGGKDEALLHKFFTPPLLEYFSAHHGWDIEAADGHVLVYQERKLQSPAQLEEFLAGAREIAATLRQRAEGQRTR